MHMLCTICSDLVNQAENIYVTKCGHIFHHHCLVQWIERSKSCPQCRNKVTERCMFRLYPNISNETTGDDAATLQSRLDDAQLQLRQQKAVCKEKENKLNDINMDLKRNEDLLRSYEKKLVTLDSAVTALKEQLLFIKAQNKELDKIKEENESLKKNIQTLNGLQKVLNATTSDVETMLQGYTDVKTIAIFATALKRALWESESKKNESRDKLQGVKQRLSAEEHKVVDLQNMITQLQDRLSNTERKYEALKNKRKAADMSNVCEKTVKQPRQAEPFDLNTAILEESNNNSLSSMVNRIANADSPYLNLKQSSTALSALTVPNNSPENRIKPSEFAIINAARAHSKKSTDSTALSIFNMKKPMMVDLHRQHNTRSLDISYDGLGGHSKPDIFPTPKPRQFKSSVPKLSAKHKLKRPSLPSGSQDIGKLLESMNQ